jgi:hypothetical protein
MERAREEGGGRRLDANEGRQAARARDAARAQQSSECDHAADHCEHGDPEACEFLKNACGYDDDEVASILDEDTAGDGPDEITGKAAQRVDGRVLVGVDEAHLVAPQDVKLPEAIKLLATTGRGKVSSIWITQRFQEIDEAVISQNNANLLGGFGSDRDRGKLDVEYPVEVHNPEADRVPNLPAELHHSEDGPVPLQKTEVDGVVRSSEWIYSTDEGEMERLDSASIDMTAEHYGGSDQKLRHPFDS